MTRSTSEKVLLGAAAGLVLGAFLPWATAGPFTVNGTSGDGVFTLALGVGVGWLTWVRKAPRFVCVCLVLAALVTIVDAADIGRLAGDDGLFAVDIGIGLWMSIAASIVGIVGWVKGWTARATRPG